MRRKGMMDDDNEITMMSRSKHLSFFSSFSHRSVNLTTSPPLPSSASAVPLGSGARAKLCQRAHPVLLRLD
ncbi:hypothetical protein DTO021C3_5078 [Paecilomyces variotii]|nr:hypothetical protein DTO021C3_5078 [Paecilomyces variotii]